MGYQTEIACRIGVAECRYGWGQCHESGDEAACIVAQPFVGIKHHVASVAGEAHVDVQSRTGFPGGDFRGEGHIEIHFLCKIAYHPFRKHKLVGGILGVDWQELYLVLFIDHAVDGEIAHFGMSILYAASGLGYVMHAPGAEIVEFRERSRFMIPPLIGCGERPVVGRDHIIFKFAHRLEFQAGGLSELGACFAQGLFRRCRHGVPVLVEKAAQHGYCRNFGKRVEECGGIAWHHIEIAVAGLDESREEA